MASLVSSSVSLAMRAMTGDRFSVSEASSSRTLLKPKPRFLTSSWMMSSIGETSRCCFRNMTVAGVGTIVPQLLSFSNNRI